MTPTSPAPDWEHVRSLYPGTAQRTYLDAAAVGLLSTRVRDAMLGAVDEHHEHGVVAGPRWRERAGVVRRSVARLVGGEEERVALVQNTSVGLATVANGLDWSPGDVVVVPEGEFPSNAYPWLHLRRLGVEVRQVAMVDGAAPVADLAAAVDDRTRVLAVSAVQYSSGHRYDLAPLARACHEHGALLVVDGTQALGAVVVDVAEVAIDVLAVSAHKWMNGPRGIGFLHLSDRAMAALTPSTVGWMTVRDPFAFEPEPHLAEDARRYESGTENTAGLSGLGATVDLVLELGRERVEERVLALAGRLADRLGQAGLEPLLPAPPHRSGIVVVRSPALPAADLHARLVEAGVQCSLRGEGLRFAPHYYSSEADLEPAAEVAAGALAGP